MPVTLDRLLQAARGHHFAGELDELGSTVWLKIDQRRREACGLPTTDTVLDHASMPASRARLRQEHGGQPQFMVMMNLAEYQFRGDGPGYRWLAHAWFGGDIDLIVVATEGEGEGEGSLESGTQALYSRARSPYFNEGSNSARAWAPRVPG